MALLLLLTPPEGGGQVEQIARTFGVDWPHFGAQLVSFAIVCALLYVFAYRRILAMLAYRREQIAQGLANAAQIKAELLRTEEQRREVMARANLEASRLIEEAQAAAARVHQEETRKALLAAQDILARAREAAVQDRARMQAELRREVGRLVAQTTAAVVGKVLTADDHRRLAEETARRLPA